VRAVVIREHGGPEVLRLEERSVPEPGACEARVRVRAVGLNHLDLWVRKGVPGHTFPLPIVPGCDVAGEIDSLGDGAAGSGPTTLAVGDRVVVGPGVSCGRCHACRSGDEQLCRSYGILGETRDGGCADFLIVPARNLFPIPAGLPFPEAAAVPLVFLTAWHMLVARAGVRSDDLVLVHAAGSGVSSAAIQIARLLGARVMATAGSDEKCARAAELGAEVTVNYREKDFAAEARRWTKALGRGGLDVAFDHVGEDTFDRTVRCLAKGGRYVTCGATSGYEMKTDFRLVFFKSLSILGSTMGGSHELQDVLAHVAAGRLRPVLDRTFPLDDVAEAHRRLEAREGFGKTVLLV
jgi:NADPH:quinone reductase-like Zn-dependent oxidoreductase